MTLWPYPTTACGESRLIWKSQAASRTPNEVLDFWESADHERDDVIDPFLERLSRGSGTDTGIAEKAPVCERQQESKRER